MASRQELGRKTGTEANIILEGECFFILVNISRSNQNRSAIWNTACCVPSVTGQQSLQRGGRLVFAGGGSGKRNSLRRLPSCVSRMVVAFLACPIPPPDPTPEYHQAILQFSFPSSMQIGDGEKEKKKKTQKTYQDPETCIHSTQDSACCQVQGIILMATRRGEGRKRVERHTQGRFLGLAYIAEQGEEPEETSPPGRKFPRSLLLVYPVPLGRRGRGHSKQAQRVPVRGGGGVLLEEGGGLGILNHTPKVLANNPRSICGLHGFPAGPRGC